MKGSRARLQRTGPTVTLAAVTLILFACSGCHGDDGSIISAGLTAAFNASGTSAAVDRLRLNGGTTGGNLLALEVVIGGSTTNQDLYSFVFDLVLSDPSVARYEPGTAQAGSALQLEAGQGRSVLVSQQDDRVVVGVSKTGGGSGNGVPDGETTIVQLQFRVLEAGVTEVRIAGQPENPQGSSAEPVALDSTGAVVDSVTFDSSPATIVVH